MALDNFTGQNIKDTFQRVVQTENGAFADGTGSALQLLTPDQTASFVTADQTASFVISEQTSSFVTAEQTASFLTSTGTYSSSLQTLGNITSSGNISASGNLIATNVNVGVPTSNNWGENLEGSFFNNFSTNTDVSEILRFMAGIISHSIDTSSPTPNTKTYNSITETLTNTGTGTAPAGRIPNNHDVDDFTYLIDNGFASIGGTLFPSKTINTNTGFSVKYSSVAAGSTSIQSSADSQLFGLGALSSGGATIFNVSGSHTFKFFKNQTAINTDTATETSSSGNILTNSSLGTSNGLTVARIESANPAVIPAAFQDGKFVNVHLQNLVNWTNQSLTSVSASGKYEITTTIGIATGSQSDYTTKTISEDIFWAPIGNINIPSQPIRSTGHTVTPLTLTSQSLSGAPYVNGGTWQYSATASGMFEPLYADSTSVIRITITQPTDVGTVTVARSSGFYQLSTNGGTIQTTGVVRDAAGTFRNSGVPHRQDSASFSTIFQISGTGTTINEGGFTDDEFNLRMRVKNSGSSEKLQTQQNVPIHAEGTFGHLAASESMGYHGGGSVSTTTIEYFTTESYRRIITDSTSLTNKWDKTARLTLGDGGDLQVKPGYLVNPESTTNGVGYWYATSGYNASHYKWYLREFDTGATSNKGTLTINLDNPSTDSSADLVNFDSTTANKIAIGVIFGSSTSTVFDAVKGNQSYGGSLNSTANGVMNPFSDAIDIKGDFSSITNSNGTLTLGLNNAGGQTINGTHDKIWLLIRYKGAPDKTLQRITVSTS